MNILIWNEKNKKEQSRQTKKQYPDGMQSAIAKIFEAEKDISIKISWQHLPDDGLSQEELEWADVLIYWAHTMHAKLADETAKRVAKRVNDGMGAIFLHSSHPSKPFTLICGASGSLHWREDGKHERLYNINPQHPIAAGVPCEILLEQEEMYGEPFDCGKPDDVIFVGWFPGGEIFRSGMTYTYGKGRVFYFQPGHETFGTYNNPDICRVIYNAAMWVTGKNERSEPYEISKDCKFVRAKEKSKARFGKKQKQSL